MGQPALQLSHSATWLDTVLETSRQKAVDAMSKIIATPAGPEAKVPKRSRRASWARLKG